MVDETGKVFAFSPGCAGMDVDLLRDNSSPGLPSEKYWWGWSDSGGEKSDYLPPEHRVSFKRAIACVKALDGIEDPQAFMAAVKEISNIVNDGSESIGPDDPEYYAGGGQDDDALIAESNAIAEVVDRIEAMYIKGD